MKLTVRRAAAADLPTLLKIFDNARAFMRTHGNPHQWPDSYPARRAWPPRSSAASAMW